MHIVCNKLYIVHSIFTCIIFGTCVPHVCMIDILHIEISVNLKEYFCFFGSQLEMIILQKNVKCLQETAEYISV